MRTESIEEAIAKYIVERFPIATTRGVNATAPLLENGILDSLGVLEVVAFLEQEFGVSVEDEDLDPSNFGSIAAMSGLVRRKQGQCVSKQCQGSEER